ncbi:MAG TPA: vitamin B12-dependent ribonucleotide reductase [Candidatus Thermoplasmatota archaeon]|nr:vitamin B12-dependent ribonucleotide reductase [Candidatus Thermoplasmatota archaeon]
MIEALPNEKVLVHRKGASQDILPGAALAPAAGAPAGSPPQAPFGAPAVGSGLPEGGEAPAPAPAAPLVRGLSIDRFYTTPGQDPYAGIEWTTRKSVIKEPDGTVVFKVDRAEVPKEWSQLATDIIVSKYFRKAGVPQPDGSLGSETSAAQVVHRIANSIRWWGEKTGYFATKDDADAFEAELKHMLITQKGAFNSPVWFNCGHAHVYGVVGSGGNWAWNEETQQVEPIRNNYARPQCSACFIQRVEDNLVERKGIFELLASEARLFKYGSGTGSNFSRLRSRFEKLSGGGTSSGLMSFLKVLDAGAGATKSGGTTRRAAKMVSLDMDHPEIEDFINWKVKEEKKVAALIAQGYESDFNGEAYATVSGQNSNNSVRVTDEFMQAVKDDGEWKTYTRMDGKVHRVYKARELWDQVAYAAWACADPGVQYDTTINTWHTCKATDRIYGSNPCSEYMFLDDTACNLASLNLMKFLKEDGTFDLEAYRHAIRVFFVAQEILVSYSSYPTRDIAHNSEMYRPLGLGYANLGTLLMVTGLPYDSAEGRAVAGALTAILTGHAYRVSAEMAAVKGPFQGIHTKDAQGRTNLDTMTEVIGMHLEAARLLRATGSPLKAMDGFAAARSSPTGLTEGAVQKLGGVLRPYSRLFDAAVEDWEAALTLGRKFGWRNAQATVLAPTGTIGLLMDCDTTGVEPDFSLVKFKKLAGGGYFKIINGSVPAALRNLGYTEEQIRAVEKYAIGAGTLEGGPIPKDTFIAKGFTEEEYQEAYDAVAASKSFNDYTPKVNPRTMKEKGFTRQAIDALVAYVEGHQTVEGSLVRKEHLAIFDCANKCGDGTRFIHHTGHIRMMAATQPFLSGAISKTINMPNEVTVEDVKEAYELGWKLQLKAVALYRDGSKLSQPLSNGKKADEKEAKVEEPGLRHGEMERPPQENDQGFKRTVTIFTTYGQEKVDIQVWEYPDGRPCEIFVGARKSGTMVDNFLKEIGKNYSRCLQLGMSLDELTRKLVSEHGPLAGQTDHKYIKTVLGIQDLLGKLLRYEYFGETGFLSVKPDPSDPSYMPTRKEYLETLRIAKQRPRNEATLADFVDAAPAISFEEKLGKKAGSDPNEFLAQMGGDAPDCDQCGHTTVRNGACYKCLNCGNSMGCS